MEELFLLVAERSQNGYPIGKKARLESAASLTTRCFTMPSPNALPGHFHPSPDFRGYL